MKIRFYLTTLLMLTCVGSLWSQESNPQVKKVYAIFKTHLDIGFTQLPSQVEIRYVNEFIPKAIEVARQLRESGAKERYVWTTGSWLISAYLEQASPEAVKKLEQAIERGDIVWNGVPYTVESESMTKEMFATILNLSKQLDKRFGKKTIAAKMTDVPGHTRSIVSPLFDADMKFLQIGVNSAATVPNVPPVCLWRNVDGKEIVLMYQKEYGSDMILPDGKCAVSINFTNDNKGPHTIERVKSIYASLRKKYPNAQIIASSLNEVAAELETMKDKMPVLTSEIGDTWIYGYGSSPIRMSKYRALSRLYSQWISNGQLSMDSKEAVDFAVRLGMIAEHTWGLDVKVFLKNWDKYDTDKFNASRDLPAFRLMEQSWKEIDENIEKAIAYLPAKLQAEAKKEIAGIGEVEIKPLVEQAENASLNANGAYTMSTKAGDLVMGEIAYQTFSADDYTKFQNTYLTKKIQWAIEDNGKPGLEQTKAQSKTIVAKLENCTVKQEAKKSRIDCRLKFDADAAIDKRMLPQSVAVEYVVGSKGKSIEMNVTLYKKPAVRLPEAYWVSFVPSQVTSVVAEKTGCRVDVLDVVVGGNRQMHAIDNYIDIITDKGTIRVSSLDAPLVAIGERSAINYSPNQPDLKQGVHFCLFNNLWGTNFSMWFEGSMKYRFKIDLI